MAKAKIEPDEPEVEFDPNAYVKASQKANPDKQHNEMDAIYHITSTGSLIWDIKLGGGLCPGLHRFLGPPESGKTSAALEICRNFLAVGGKRRGLYFKAEGRLSHEMKERCGLPFVEKIEEWKDGTIFVVKSNIYEYCINLMRGLIKGRKSPHLYCIIIDSTDGMILDADSLKTIDENAKVAGTPALTKKFLQSMANEMSENGHLCLMLSQYSSNIQLDTYAAAEDRRPKQGGGGWGAAHFANWAFEFLAGWNEHDILEKPGVKAGKDNERIGKKAVIKFKKTLNETTNSMIEYPIRFKVIGGSSIWRSMEVSDLCIGTGRIRRGGAWFNPTPDFVKEVKAAGADMPEKIQGENKLYKWFEEHPAVCDSLYDMLRKTLTTKGDPNAFPKA